MPQTALEERLRVFSIVNTLTGIDNVDAVRILVSGAPVERYLYLDLQQDLVREPSVIAAAHPALSTFDATLCLPMEGQSGLFACPIQLESRANEDKCRLVLDALLAYSGGKRVLIIRCQRGLYHPGIFAGRMASATLISPPIPWATVRTRRRCASANVEARHRPIPAGVGDKLPGADRRQRHPVAAAPRPLYRAQPVLCSRS